MRICGSQGENVMRGTGVLYAALGLAAAVAVLIASDPPAGARSVAPPTPGGGNNNTRVNNQLFDAPLAALAAGAQTIGGPGSFVASGGENSLIYEVQGAPAPDACITVRNLSTANVQVIVAGADTVEIGLNRTRAACYAAPTQIILRCESGACAAVWRIDRL
jgi:hypothetical protein